MQKESLEKAKQLIIQILESSDIDKVDKTELMINENVFLENYDEMIKVKVKKLERTNRIHNNI